jgi:hypothetical protein
MRVAILILRKNYYRLLAPVVEEALRRGWQVDCWHDWSHPRRGGKASEFPDADATPSFRAGAPRVRRFNGAVDLAQQLATDAPDALISLDPPDPRLRSACVARWVWLQYSTDIVYDPTVRGFVDADAIATYSGHWSEVLDTRYGGSVAGPPALRDKLVAVGVPELDAVRDIDPAEVRARLGIEPGRPVVLYLPFPLRSNPATFWLRHVYAPRTRVSQALHVSLGRRPEYWPHVRRGWNDRCLVQAVRAFCNRNGAALVTKARHKDPVPGYARRLADHVVYDPSVYPATILELLRIASLCIHFYSTATFEAAYCGVPALCLAPDAVDMGLPDHIHDLVHNGKPGGIYNWQGVAYWQPLREAFDGLGDWRLEDFPLVTRARRQYVEQYLGFDDGRSAGRLLDLVGRTVVEAAPAAQVAP